MGNGGNNTELTRMFDEVYPGSHSNLRKVSVQISSERIFVVKGRGATPWPCGPHRTVFPHPTLSETFYEAALATDGEAIHMLLEGFEY